MLEYGSLDGVYENVDKLKGKLKEKIETDKESAYMSYKLASINTDCDVDFSLDKMKLVLPFSSSVKKKFAELEFRALQSRSDFFGSEEEILTEKESERSATSEKFEKKSFTELNFINELKDKKFLAFAFTETQMCFFADGTEYSVKLKRDLIDDGVDFLAALRYFKDIFQSDKTLVLYDKKSVKKMLLNFADINLTAFSHDVSLMKYLGDFSGGEQTFEQIMEEYNLDLSSPARSLYEIYLVLMKKIEEIKVKKVYEEVELPLSDVLFDMEREGFKVNVSAIYETGKKFAETLRETENEIYRLVGETFNLNSPKQLGVVLFEKLKIGKGKKTKTGYSTSAEVLESLEEAHPVVPLILKYRKIQKLQSTYIEGFKPLIDSKTGLVHTTFHQTVTATGRLSSKEPNLQNIPVRDNDGKELRKFFVSRFENGVIVDADYSQIELRLLAAFSGCKTLIKAFNDGKDIHASTAAKVFNVKESEVTERQRRDAKAVNFGVIYGISEYGLAKNIKISVPEAREYIKSYFIQFPEVKEYMSANVEFAKANGYAETLLGRKRYIRELSSSNGTLRQFGERVAMNMPLQGSSADLIKVAMINVSERLKREKLEAVLILQVHDELVIDSPKEEEEKVKNILEEEMENAARLSVVLTAEVSSGKSWFEAK